MIECEICKKQDYYISQCTVCWLWLSDECIEKHLCKEKK